MSAHARPALSPPADHTLKVWELETGEASLSFACEGGDRCRASGVSRTIVAGDVLRRIEFLSLEPPDDTHLSN